MDGAGGDGGAGGRSAVGRASFGAWAAASRMAELEMMRVKSPGPVALCPESNPAFGPEACDKAGDEEAADTCGTAPAMGCSPTAALPGFSFGDSFARLCISRVNSPGLPSSASRAGAPAGPASSGVALGAASCSSRERKSCVNPPAGGSCRAARSPLGSSETPRLRKNASDARPDERPESLLSCRPGAPLSADGEAAGVAKNSVTPALPETASLTPGAEKPRIGAAGGVLRSPDVSPGVSRFFGASSAFIERIRRVNSPGSASCALRGAAALSAPHSVPAFSAGASEALGSRMKIRVKSLGASSPELGAGSGVRGGASVPASGVSPRKNCVNSPGEPFASGGGWDGG